MIKVTAPDGSEVSFPDGTSEGQINDIMSKAFAPPQAGNSFEGSAKAIGSGLVAGAEKLLGAPADIISAVTGKPNELGYENIKKNVEKNITGPLYQPQTGAEKVMSGISEFGIGALGGPGSLGRRVLTNVVAPGVGSEAAGALTNDNPIAKIIGGLGGLGAAHQLGGMRDAAAARKALPAVPTLEKVDDATNTLYNTQALKDVRLVPGVAKDLFVTAEKRLQAQYIDPRGEAKPVYTALRNGRAPVNGPSYSMHDIDNVRKQLGTLAGKGGTLGNAATQALTTIDDLLPFAIRRPYAVAAGNAEQAVADLGVARASAATGFRGSAIQKIIDDAKIDNAAAHSGGNFQNTLYRLTKPLLKSGMRGFNEVEKEAVKAIPPGKGASALRASGKYLGSGGGLGQAFTTLLGNAIGGPAGAIALPAIGKGLGMAGDAAALKRAEKALETVLARSPQYASHYKEYLRLKKAGKGLESLPPKQLAAVLALIAANPVKD